MEDKFIEALRHAGKTIVAQAALIDELYAKVKDLKNRSDSRETALGELQSILDNNPVTTTGDLDTVGDSQEGNLTPAMDAAVKVIDEMPTSNTDALSEAVSTSVDSQTPTDASVVEDAFNAIADELQNSGETP